MGSSAEKQLPTLTNEKAVGDDGNEFEIDLLDLFFYLQSKWIWILGCFITGGLIFGLVTFFFITPKFSAVTKLYMVSASSDTLVNLSDLNLGTSLSEDYKEVIQIRPIYEDVIKELELPYTYDQLSDMVSISVVNNTRILSIRVTSPYPEEAADIANAIAKDAESRVPKMMDTSKPHIIEPAIVPDTKSSPSYSKNIMIGALLGAIIIISILTVMYVMDDTFNSPEDVEKMFGIMPLTTIPESDIGVLSEILEHSDHKHRGIRRFVRKGFRSGTKK